MVTKVRNDMVNDRCGHILALRQTLHAQRVLPQGMPCWHAATCCRSHAWRLKISLSAWTCVRRSKNRRSVSDSRGGLHGFSAFLGIADTSFGHNKSRCGYLQRLYTLQLQVIIILCLCQYFSGRSLICLFVLFFSINTIRSMYVLISYILLIFHLFDFVGITRWSIPNDDCINSINIYQFDISLLLCYTFCL